MGAPDERFLHVGLGKQRFFLETDKWAARTKGDMAYQRGNLQLAWQWWRRYDDLQLLEFVRKEYRQTSTRRKPGGLKRHYAASRESSKEE